MDKKIYNARNKFMKEMIQHGVILSKINKYVDNPYDKNTTRLFWVCDNLSVHDSVIAFDCLMESIKGLHSTTNIIKDDDSIDKYYFEELDHLVSKHGKDFNKTQIVKLSNILLPSIILNAARIVCYQKRVADKITLINSYYSAFNNELIKKSAISIFIEEIIIKEKNVLSSKLKECILNNIPADNMTDSIYKILLNQDYFSLTKLRIEYYVSTGILPRYDDVFNKSREFTFEVYKKSFQDLIDSCETLDKVGNVLNFIKIINFFDNYLLGDHIFDLIIDSQKMAVKHKLADDYFVKRYFFTVPSDIIILLIKSKKYDEASKLFEKSKKIKGTLTLSKEDYSRLKYIYMLDDADILFIFNTLLKGDD